MKLRKQIIFVILFFLIIFTGTTTAFTLPVYQLIKNDKQVRVKLNLDGEQMILTPLQQINITDLQNNKRTLQLEMKKEYQVKPVNDTGFFWRIQVFASFDREKAGQIRDELLKQSYQNTRLIKDGDWFKVQLGDFARRQQAETAAEDLKENGWQTFLVRYHQKKGSGQLGIFSGDELLMAGRDFSFNGKVKLDNEIYDGIFAMLYNKKGLEIFNTLSLEKLIYSLLSTEFTRVDKQEEAVLQAQAVVFRTEILRLLGEDKQGYLTLPAYHGTVFDNYQFTRAIRTTEGQVLQYNKNLIRAAYHQNSGGYTADSESVLNYSFPYLQAKKDFVSSDSWTYTFNHQDLIYLLKIYVRNKMDTDLFINGIRNIRVIETGPSGRITRINIITDFGVYTLEKEEIRDFFIYLGLVLPGNKYELKKDFKDGYLNSLTITGSGEGHGLGLSLDGALVMARADHNYQEILHYYYTDVELLDLTQHVEEKQLVNASIQWGLEYQEIRQMTWWGPRSLTVIDLNLNRLGFEIIPVLAGGKIAGLENLADMVLNEDALVGINGGYFSYTGRPLGLLIKDGLLVSEPLKNRTALGINSAGEILMEQVDWQGIISKTDGTVQAEISGVNRKPGTDEIVIFNHFYGPAAPQIKAGIIEVVVMDGRIALLRDGSLDKSSQPNSIPENGYVLQAHGQARNLLAPFSRGDQVSYHDDYSTDWQEKKIISGLGGGPRLLRDGEIAINGQEEGFQPDILTGRAPRSAVGITADNHLILVTIDGRQPELSIGMTLEEMAIFLKKIGVINAMNLDGGGSARMVVRGYTMNNPSDKRMISNGLLIKYKSQF